MNRSAKVRGRRLNAKRSDNMRLERRGIVLAPSDLRGMTETWLDWLAEAELNVLGIHTDPQSAIHWVESEKGKTCLKSAEARKIAVEYELHAINWLMSRSLFERHPDWFRMNGGGRRVSDVNLCVSNPDALNHLGERAAEHAKRVAPTTNRYYYWADDTGEWCQCPKCRDLSPSDQNVLAMNAIGAKLREIRPDAKLACLAYWNTLNPPIHANPSNALFLEYAPIRRNSARPLNDPDDPVNAEHLANLRRLTETFSMKDAQVLEYWMDASRFSGWRRPSVKIPFDERVIAQDVKCYADLGFRSATSFAVFVDEDYVRRHGVPPIKEYGKVLGRA